MTKKQYLVEVLGLCNSSRLTPKEFLLFCCLIKNDDIRNVLKSNRSDTAKVEIIRAKGVHFLINDESLDDSLSLIELLYDSKIIIYTTQLFVDIDKELFAYLPTYKVNKKLVKEIYEIKS